MGGGGERETLTSEQKRNTKHKQKTKNKKTKKQKTNHQAHKLTCNLQCDLEFSIISKPPPVVTDQDRADDARKATELLARQESAKQKGYSRFMYH